MGRIGQKNTGASVSAPDMAAVGLGAGAGTSGALPASRRSRYPGARTDTGRRGRVAGGDERFSSASVRVVLHVSHAQSVRQCAVAAFSTQRGLLKVGQKELNRCRFFRASEVVAQRLLPRTLRSH